MPVPVMSVPNAGVDYRIIADLLQTALRHESHATHTQLAEIISEVKSFKDSVAQEMQSLKDQFTLSQQNREQFDANVVDGLKKFAVAHDGSTSRLGDRMDTMEKSNNNVLETVKQLDYNVTELVEKLDDPTAALTSTTHQNPAHLCISILPSRFPRSQRKNLRNWDRDDRPGRVTFCSRFHAFI
jgi:hypothetical protein